MRGHWPFAILAAAALALLLINLGRDYLWEDEGDTAVLASSILKNGVPKAWDGVSFLDSDQGTRENRELIVVSHPWLQYYVAAGSFFLFGRNTFAARLPFALAGWVTILLVYWIAWRSSGSRLAGFCAAMILTMSVQFLLYSRQCRNYSLNMVFTCALLAIFLSMESRRGCAWFTLTAICLFCAHPIGLIPIGVLCIMPFIYKPFFSKRQWVSVAVPIIGVFALLCLVQARRHGQNTTAAATVGDFFARLVQFFIECGSVTPLIGVLGLSAAVYFIASRGGISPKDFWQKREADVLVSVALLVTAYGGCLALTQSIPQLWYLGVRNSAALLPLLTLAVGILIARVGSRSPKVWVPLLVAFSTTKLAQLNPWVCLCNRAEENRIGVVTPHVTSRLVDSFICTEQWLYLRDLWAANFGSIANICDFLDDNAKSDDELTINYGWEAVYFYTQLPQALTILPDYPVYPYARAKGLPDYVFDVDHVRWLIWRRAFEGYMGYDWQWVRRKIAAAGGHLVLVTEITETRWENRENIHFHRFARNEYLFPRTEWLEPIGVFRVDWHQPDERSTSRSIGAYATQNQPPKEIAQ